MKRGLFALENETEGRQFKIESHFLIPGEEEQELKVSDRALIEILGPKRWRSSHITEWTENGKRRSLGRRCVRIDDKYYTSSQHGRFTLVKARAKEEQRCLQRPFGLVIDWLSPIRSDISAKVMRDIKPAGVDAVRIELSGSQDRDLHPIASAWHQGDSEAKTSSIFGPRGYLYSDRARLESLTGLLRLKSKNALILSADIEAKFAVKKADRQVELSVVVRVDTDKFEEPIEPPEDPRRAQDRPRIFQDMKTLLGIDAKRSGRRSLPKPGDAPRLVVGSDGTLTTGRPPKGNGEDVPPTTPKRVIQDEDIPR